jgi:cytochrome c oxidase subunit 4
MTHSAASAAQHSPPGLGPADGHGPSTGYTVHVVPAWLLVTVWAALACLTYATVKATGFNLGALNLWLAMAIATAKGSLVALYFMHLRWDKPFYAIVFIGALVFVMLFVGLALMDSLQYQPELIPDYAPELQL